VEHEDCILIFDAGSGIRQLGEYLMAREDLPRIKGNLFITHTHWDHIQGLPFFVPAYMEENRFSIYGEHREKSPLTELLEDQMQAPYFPVKMGEAFDAQTSFHDFQVGETIAVMAGIDVVPFRTVHPNLCVGYLARLGDYRVAYVPDHEHRTGKIDANVLKHVKDADVLIHDAHFTREELEKGKSGWGHSAWEDAVALAIEANVKKLFLFHHAPEATDEVLNERQFLAQQIFPDAFVAREGLKVPLA
jgi:phosphoribosyl 1,2-cyclic phosphodiesterase